MKYHLSTLLLAMVIVALGLGWFLDHYNRNRTEIVGTWHYPYQSSPKGISGYYTSLTIGEDGSFNKIEGHRFESETYTGTYRVEKEGIILFHVTKKTSKMDREELWTQIYKARGEEPPNRGPIELNVYYKTRCAVDKAGFLLLDNQGLPFDEDSDCKIRWNNSFERSK
jgi:hypothetical protein